MAGRGEERDCVVEECTDDLFETRFLQGLTCILRAHFHISLYRELKQRVLVAKRRIDARWVETHRLSKIGHGCSLVTALPKKQHRSLQGCVFIEADRSSCLSISCLHAFSFHHN